MKPGLGVGVMILKDDKILLGLRNPNKEKASSELNGQGTWTMPGGKVDYMEKLIDAAKRELEEETGTIVNNANLMSVSSVVVNWLHHDEMESMHHIGIIYEVSIDDGNIKDDADGLDSLGAAWYAINDLSKDILSPLTCEALLLKGYDLK